MFDIEEDEDASYSMRPIKVGAGSATNEKFGTSSGLQNPLYVGKAMFVYVNSKELQHLGRTKIAKEFNFKDPMDLVPIS